MSNDIIKNDRRIRVFQSMRCKMVMVMLGITVVTAALITAVFYWKSSEMIEKNYTENLYARLSQTGDALDESMEEVYYLTTLAACDSEILKSTEEFLESGDENELVLIAGLLRDYAVRNSDLASVYLVIPGRKVIVTSQEYPVCQKEISEVMLREIGTVGENALTPVMLKDPVRETADILSYVSPVEDEGREAPAYIMGNIKERSLYYNYLDGLESGRGITAVILDRNSRLVSSRNPAKAGEISDKNEKSSAKEVLQVEYLTNFTEYSLRIEKEKSEVLTDLRQMRMHLLGVLAAVFVLGAVLIVVLTGAMYAPLRKLTETMAEVSGGELGQRVEITTRDEIGILSGEFNDMLNHIEKLIEKLIQEEMLKKDAELEALQYQITPHFMYNTLNSIKYAALLKGEDRIGGLVEDFVELLQASANKKGKFVTVAEELHLVENYLNLQRMRYEDKIEVEYQVDENACGCFLPRLVLQPLVENAILHGLDLKNKRNRITIGGTVENESLSLWVQDNGRGMTKEQTEKLLNEKKKKDSGLSGIGVTNVRERLALYYKEAGGIICESSNEGTRISIFLPAYREQNRYAL